MVLAVGVLPWIPESPRWLVYQDRHSEALDAIALTHSDGNREDPVVLLTYQEIIDTLQTEVELGQQTGYRDLVKSKSSMRRVMLVISVAIISMVSGKKIYHVLICYMTFELNITVSGNNIITFYLGAMLDNAGVTDSTTQLEIVRDSSNN